MKYVNATTRCYNSIVQSSQEQSISFVEPFESIYLNEDNGHYFIRGFFIQTEISILGTNKKENEKENPICRGDKLHFTLRLTKCDRNEENRLGIDLDEFEIDLKELKENNKLFQACYSYYSGMRVSAIQEIELPFDGGKCVLKVLVRNTDDPKDDTIQSMSNFTVKKSEKSI